MTFSHSILLKQVKSRLRSQANLILNAGKFRKPIIMFHGTSSTFLPSILKNGLVPNPPKKRWDEDKDHYIYNFSRESLPGSYWTSNYMTASSSATNTMKKFGGEELIVIAQIAEQSSYADEDNVNDAIKEAMNDTVASLNPHIRSSVWISLVDNLAKDKEKIQDRFAKNLHKRLEGSDKHPINRKLTNDLLDCLILRDMAVKKHEGIQLGRWMTKVPENIPPISEIEKTLLGLRDSITRSYRKTAFYSPTDFNHTLRNPNVVGFKGNNKILWILQFKKWKWITYKNGNDKLKVFPAILIYGKLPLPDVLLEQYKKRVGDWPGLVDKNGKVLMKSQRKNNVDKIAAKLYNYI